GTCETFGQSNPNLRNSAIGNDTASSIQIGAECPGLAGGVACQNCPRTWGKLPGLARDIGAGADGSVWVIGTNPVGNDGVGDFRWTGSDWEAIDGGGVRIDVDEGGNPWVVNSGGQIFRRINDRWQLLPGLARDIGAGADGSVWVIGTNPVG